MRNRKAFSIFVATCRARATFELAALDLMPHIYTEKMCEEIASKENWLEQVAKDSAYVLNLQYEATKEKNK